MYPPTRDNTYKLLDSNEGPKWNNSELNWKWESIGYKVDHSDSVRFDFTGRFNYKIRQSEEKSGDFTNELMGVSEGVKQWII
jgi:hypothetical protein